MADFPLTASDVPDGAVIFGALRALTLADDTESEVELLIKQFTIASLILRAKGAKGDKGDKGDAGGVVGDNSIFPDYLVATSDTQKAAMRTRIGAASVTDIRSLGDGTVFPRMLVAADAAQKAAMRRRIKAASTKLDNLELATNPAAQRVALVAMGSVLAVARPIASAAYLDRTFIHGGDNTLYVGRNRPHAATATTALWAQAALTNFTVSSDVNNVTATLAHLLYDYSSSNFYVGEEVAPSRTEWVQSTAQAVLIGASTAGWTVEWLGQAAWDYDATQRMPNVLAARTDYFFYNTTVQQIRKLGRSTFVGRGTPVDHYQWEPLRVVPPPLVMVAEYVLEGPSTGTFKLTALGTALGFSRGTEAAIAQSTVIPQALEGESLHMPLNYPAGHLPQIIVRSETNAGVVKATASMEWRQVVRNFQWTTLRLPRPGVTEANKIGNEGQYITVYFGKRTRNATEFDYWSASIASINANHGWSTTHRIRFYLQPLA